MFKQLLSTMKLHKQTPLGIVLCEVFAFLLGFGLVCLVLTTDTTTDSHVTLGTIFALAGLVIYFFVGAFTYVQDFNLAISMGKTRREFLITHVLEQLLCVAAGYALLLLLSLLEGQLYGLMFPWAYSEFSLLSVLLDWRLALGVIPGVVIVMMFLGAMHCRFGKTFAVIAYFVWLACCMSLPHIASLFEAGHPAVIWILRIPAAGWVGIGVAAAALMTAVTVQLSMKQQVR